MFIVELNDQMSEHSEHFPLSWSFHVVSRAQHSILLQSWTRRHVFHLHMVKHLQIWKKSKDCCGLPSGNLTYIELLIYSWFTKKMWFSMIFHVIFHDFPNVIFHEGTCQKRIAVLAAGPSGAWLPTATLAWVAGCFSTIWDTVYQPSIWHYGGVSL